MASGGKMDRLDCPCCKVNNCTPATVTSLALLEKELGELRVTSGYRCKEHNASLPNAAKNSKHVLGKAIDVLIPADVSDRDFIAAAHRAGFNGIGISVHRWAHCDRRGASGIWAYDSSGKVIPYTS